ncbi:MAG: acyl-CoA dehydrogenase family protein [Sorangiineae bacterium]|nr:acyl-CoA dehydrogenase family protein [Polyangiaceae bacterium]MEB2323676.1 acyl-CoA dehydrogenase family protein [Sorangiineae bacterium]
MYLEIPKKLRPFVEQAHLVGEQVFRPISRKYDAKEHEYPVELDMLAAVVDGMNQSGSADGAGASKLKREKSGEGVRNGANMSTALGLTELCWGDCGLALTIPRQGLGNAAITAVANEEQLARFNRRWAAMAITEPNAGSDSASIRTTARLDGDQYVLNGEKIFVTSGSRADLIVVWATLDPSLGRAAIKSFVVEAGTPGMEVARLEHKLGIKASDTATILLTDCRIPKENLLGDPEIRTGAGFAGVMQTFDNTRPLVAAMAVGVARAALERTRELLAEAGDQADFSRSPLRSTAAEAEIYRMEAELEAARLLTLRAAWMADNGIPNSKEASIAKAKAGRVGNAITLRCLQLAGSLGSTETELLEKWARDSKILDIFEGTQQIQLLIIARRLLGKSSSELK